MNSRVSIFIDGSNFYHGAGRILSKGTGERSLLPIKFNYHGLINWLAGKRKIIQMMYYVGLVRRDPDSSDRKTEDMVRNQQRLFAWLESSSQNIQVVRGHLMRYPDQKYHEKGVDVRIALDLAQGAFENIYDTAILLSSDTDLIPALQRVRKYKKHIEYIGFADQPSYGLQRYANISRLLTREDVVKFLPKTLI